MKCIGPNTCVWQLTSAQIWLGPGPQSPPPYSLILQLSAVFTPRVSIYHLSNEASILSEWAQDADLLWSDLSPWGGCKNFLANMDFLSFLSNVLFVLYCLVVLIFLTVFICQCHAAKLYYADLYILSTDFEWLFPVQFPESETLKWWRPFGRPLKYGTAFFHRDQWYMGVCIVVGYGYRGIADLLSLPSLFQNSFVCEFELSWAELRMTKTDVFTILNGGEHCVFLHKARFFYPCCWAQTLTALAPSILQFCT